MHILVIDDDSISLSSLGDTLVMLGHEPVLCDHAEAALTICKDRFFPIIVTDIRMPVMDGLELLKRLKAMPESAESDVIMVTGHGDVETAITALRHGAYDFLKKPLDARELSAVIERSAEHQALRWENKELSFHCDRIVEEATGELRRNLDHVRRTLRSVVGIGDVLATSEVMKRVLEDARLYHDNPDVSVLIEGETGTGKEVVARLIHFGEEGADTPFIDLNCSVISENLFESELFGYEAGSFTGGARQGAKGKLEAAGKGTLFLDEIGELPLHIQPKLLRVLQERSFFRVGGIKKRPFQARIVCATNRNLERMVEQGEFRRDLYHRFKIGYIHLPPLRERPEDIDALAALFIMKEAKNKGKKFREISPGALEILRAYSWKGNIRELKNSIERAILVHSDTVLKPEHLAFLHETSGNGNRSPQAAIVTDTGSLRLPESPFNLDDYLEGIKRDIVEQAVAKFRGNKTRAAKYLGWDRNKIYRLLDLQ
ncbi:MAG: sigma-54-dependent transcriptional regulator [Desulfovibrionaceae bacterium]